MSCLAFEFEVGEFIRVESHSGKSAIGKVAARSNVAPESRLYLTKVRPLDSEFNYDDGSSYSYPVDVDLGWTFYKPSEEEIAMYLLANPG